MTQAVIKVVRVCRRHTIVSAVVVLSAAAYAYICELELDCKYH